MDTLQEKVVLLTGASRGIGPYIARALGARGAVLGLTARDAAALEGLAAALRDAHIRAAAFPADLLRSEERLGLVRQVERELGPIDVLVNDAGVETEGAFVDLDPAAISGTIELNLAAPLHLASLVLPRMLARRAGHVVSIASLGGKKGVPYAAVYCATKAGLIEWHGALRGELGGTGVSTSVICPGYVTEEGMFARSEVAPPARLGWCTPDEVAGAVVRAIERDLREVIVNSRPVRPLLALSALSPRIGAWVLDRLGVTDLQRARLAVARRRAHG